MWAVARAMLRLAGVEFIDAGCPLFRLGGKQAVIETSCGFETVKLFWTELIGISRLAHAPPK